MEPDAIGKAYDQIADRWRDGTFPRSRGIAAHECALRFLRGGKAALDVGCGCNTRISRLLGDRGLEVEGIDVSERMIELAREASTSQMLYHADICTWTLPKQYDFITAWESLMHLPISEVEGVLAKLMKGLNPGGVFIFTCAAINTTYEAINTAMGPAVSDSEIGLPAIVSVAARCNCTVMHLEIYAEPLGAFLVVQAPFEKE